MDMFDDDLKEVMGDRYDDGEILTQMPVMECKPRPKAAEQSEIQKNETMEAAYIALTQKPRDLFDRLFDMTKWLGICGGICMLLWWFEVNGLMAMEAAYPCILATAMIGTGGTVWSAK